MQLKVAKCDGTTEVYLHTKVMGSIAAALGGCGDYEPRSAEQLAEAVTTFVKKRYGCGKVQSSEIHSMVQVVLSDTGYEQAALKLHEHRIERQVRRGRVSVIDRESADEWDNLAGCQSSGNSWPLEQHTRAWNKSLIVENLEGESELPHDLARVVAGGVEEKVLSLKCRILTTSLIRELVSNELLAMRQAEKALSSQVTEETETSARLGAGVGEGEPAKVVASGSG